jgi:ABC-type dipeptide/oligopeptide/nickel transport system permease component
LAEENALGRFIARRVGRSLLTLWLVVTIAFVVLRASGDPTVAMLGPDAPVEAIDAFRASYGLDDSIVTQYFRYLRQLLSGDLGDSMQYHRPVTELFWQRLPATLELAAVALVIAVVIGIPAGILAAMKRNSIWDRTTMFAAFAGQSAPNFFIGILLIFFLSMRLGWLPSSGRGDFEQMIMPSITLATGLLAGLARMTRSSVLEVSHADYIRTARAKGLPNSQVLSSHILRNAALPIVTMFGMWMSGVIGGTAVTETVFAWPGVGRLIVDAVSRRDFPVVQTLILFIAMSVILVNLIVDLAYGWLDPRISVTSR